MTEKSQIPTGKISIGLQRGSAELETRNLSVECLRCFSLALLLVLDPLYLIARPSDKVSDYLTCVDCCLMPCEQFQSYVMTRTSYFLLR